MKRKGRPKGQHSYNWKTLCAESGVDPVGALALFHKILEHLKHRDAPRVYIEGFGSFWVRSSELIVLTPKQRAHFKTDNATIGGQPCLDFTPSKMATTWLRHPTKARHFGEPNPALLNKSGKTRRRKPKDGLQMLARHQERIRELQSLGKSSEEIRMEFEKMKQVMIRLQFALDAGETLATPESTNRSGRDE